MVPMATKITVMKNILMDNTIGNFSGWDIEDSIGKIKPIPSNDVTATPINIVQLFGLKFEIFGPIPLVNKLSPEK